MWIFSQCSRSGKPAARARAWGAGFTLIELLVVISIMLILTSVFLLRQQTFNSSTLLRSLAYSIGLSVRQAQVYGISIRESSAGAFDAGTAARAYGVYFSSANASSYILFADLNNNGAYDASPDESVQVFKIAQGYAISKFCAGANCTDSATPITYLTILFKRPNPDSCFASSLQPAACTTGTSPVYTSGYVQVKSGSDTRSMTVTITGQISVGAKGS